MLCDLDMVVVFGKYHCVVIMEADNSKVFEGFRRGDLYIVDFSADSQLAVCLLAKALECWLWHRRLGHAGMRNLHTLAKKKHVIGIEHTIHPHPRLYGDHSRLCLSAPQHSQHLNLQRGHRGDRRRRPHCARECGAIWKQDDVTTAD